MVADIQEAPHVVNDGQHPYPRPQHDRRPSRHLSFDIHQADLDWAELVHTCQDIELINQKSLAQGMQEKATDHNRFWNIYTGKPKGSGKLHHNHGH